MKYSITKALVTYHPQEIIKSIYESPKDFLEGLREFFKERIKYNKKNPRLKRKETDKFWVYLMIFRILWKLIGIIICLLMDSKSI